MANKATGGNGFGLSVDQIQSTRSNAVPSFAFVIDRSGNYLTDQTGNRLLVKL